MTRHQIPDSGYGKPGTISQPEWYMPISMEESLTQSNPLHARLCATPATHETSLLPAASLNQPRPTPSTQEQARQSRTAVHLSLPAHTSQHPIGARRERASPYSDFPRAFHRFALGRSERSPASNTSECFRTRHSATRSKKITAAGARTSRSAPQTSGLGPVAKPVFQTHTHTTPAVGPPLASVAWREQPGAGRGAGALAWQVSFARRQGYADRACASTNSHIPESLSKTKLAEGRAARAILTLHQRLRSPKAIALHPRLPFRHPTLLTRRPRGRRTPRPAAPRPWRRPATG